MPRNLKNNAGPQAICTGAERPQSFDYIKPAIIDILRELNAWRVLDIGAGNGVLCSEIAREGYQVVGFDCDHEKIDVARGSYPAIRFYKYDVQDNPSKISAMEEPFDVVVSTEVVEHLFSPHMLPLFAKKVLNDDGHLVITTPYHGYLKNLALSVFNKWERHHTPLWHGGHIKFWSRNSLTRLLQENGFEVVSFSGLGRVPYLWKSMLLVAKKRH